MWTEEFAICDSCGGEVRLVTDGREAYASGEPAVGVKASAGWTRVVWRDGLDLVAACPVKPDHCDPFSCGQEVRFHGEGRGVEAPQVSSMAAPIHDQVP